MMNRNILAAWTLLGIAALFAALPVLVYAANVTVIFQAAVNRPLNVPGAINLQGSSNRHPIRMGIDPTSPGRIFGYSNNISQNRMKISTDGGVTFSDNPTLTPYGTLAQDVVVTSTGRIAIIGVQTTNACEVDLSDNQGTTFLQRILITGAANRGCILHGSVNGDRVITFDSNAAYIVAQHDVWKSTDNLNSWTRIRTGDGVSFTTGTVLYDAATATGAGAGGFGGTDTWPYTVGGDAWDQLTGAINIGCNGGWKMGGQVIFACARSGGGIDFRTTDGSIVQADVRLNGVNTWYGQAIVGTCFDRGGVCYMLAMSTLDNKAYIFYSRNDGASWTQHPYGALVSPSIGAPLYYHSMHSVDGGETIYFCGPYAFGVNGVWRIAH